MVELVATKTELCNLALLHVAGDVVANIDTEKSQEAEICLVYYNTALAYVLGDADWKFGSAKKPLVSVPLDVGDGPTTADLDGWRYLYVYPTDCVKIREILTANQAQSIDGFGFGNVDGAAYGPANLVNAHAILYPQAYTNSEEQGFGDTRAPAIPFNTALIGDTKYIFCDVPDARARFTRAIGNIAAYPIEFTILFSWYLAHLIAYPITRKFEIRQAMLQSYVATKAEMFARNEVDGTNIKRDPPAPWIRARDGY